MDGNIIILAVVILGIIGLVAAILLFFISKAFKVEENPLIDDVAAQLPGANCGGCGFAGCRGLAEAIVKAGNLEGLRCPAGGNSTMENIAKIMGLEAVAAEPMVAVVRCNGSCENAPAKVNYDSMPSCFFANSLYAGESACPYGCLGCGDCVGSCQFNALHIDPVTKLPVVDVNACVGCGACVKNCPRHIIELRFKGTEGRVYVTCMNKEKGPVAKKNCSAACIGCGKCAKNCPAEAITVQDSLAYIDFRKCTLCQTCVSGCPTGAIKFSNL